MTPDIKEQAIALGAVTCRTYRVKDRLWNVSNGVHHSSNPFSLHFFNKDDEEVGSYILDIGRMVTYSPPRVWSPEFKTHPDYTLSPISS